MRKVIEVNGEKIIRITGDEVNVNGKTMYDVGEFFGIERPNICFLPEWKIDFELKGKCDFGYLRESRK